MEVLRKHAVLNCICIFMICVGARIFEYFVIRTDETFLSENVIHKIFGIALLFIVLRLFHLTWDEIGFKKNRVFLELGKGLLLGTACFLLAYSVECLILYLMNHNVHLEFYASGFSLTNDMQKQIGIGFILLCIVFNLINVWMEEGIFRGLFSSFLEMKSFVHASFIIAFFFGIWHLVMPFRDYLDGNSTFANMLLMGIGYIILAGIMSIKWSFLYNISGSLWMGIEDFVWKI